VNGPNLVRINPFRDPEDFDALHPGDAFVVFSHNKYDDCYPCDPVEGWFELETVYLLLSRYYRKGDPDYYERESVLVTWVTCEGQVKKVELHAHGPRPVRRRS